MQAYAPNLARHQAAEILAGPPKSGTLSVYSQKATSLAFVWLCAVVVWGNVANAATIEDKCDSKCAVQIAFGVICWVYVSLLLILNHSAESGKVSRQGFFSHGLEVQWIGLLVVLWIPILVSVSMIHAAPIVANWFAWLGFFGTLYAMFKAYHSFKEEDLPSALPEGYDEEDVVYG